jgi:hypothetical protein
MHIKRLVSLAACAIVMGVLGPVGQAQAGSTWGQPQEISSNFGRDIQLSDSGQVAAWIRTNRVALQPSGPVRTAIYLGEKKGWTDSAQMPGTAESISLQLSADGNSLLVVNEEGAGIATRSSSTNTWAAPASVVADRYLMYARMSADAGTVVWVSSDGFDRRLRATTRNADGTWSPPVTIGVAWASAYYSGVDPAMALSQIGNMVVWLGEGKALQSSVRAADGTWSPPLTIKTYGGWYELFGIRLSKDGTRLGWFRDSADGAFTATWSGSDWSAVDNITVDKVTDLALSPNGKYAAWANQNGKVKVAGQSNGQFSTASVVGKGAAMLPVVLLSNTSVAWSQQEGGNLRASVRKGATWQPSVKVGKQAIYPAMSADGKTVAWSMTGKKRIYSVKR